MPNEKRTAVPMSTAVLMFFEYYFDNVNFSPPFTLFTGCRSVLFCSQTNGKELQKFIQSQPSEITGFDEALVKKLLEKVTVHDDYLEFRFKSGVTISIEM